jgi:hypoxanthine phosphoribosyltransferase
MVAEHRKIDYPFGQFVTDIPKLVRMIQRLQRDRGRPFKRIYTPARGGAIGAVCLSHALSPPDDPTNEVEVIVCPKDRVTKKIILPVRELDSDGFIYDEIADTGHVLNECAKMGFPIFTLVWAPWCSYAPASYLHIKEDRSDWYVFWWEKFESLYAPI